MAKKYADIVRLVAEEVRNRPEAVLDFLDALVLAANAKAEEATVPGHQGTWLGIATVLDRTMKELHPHVPRSR